MLARESCDATGHPAASFRALPANACATTPADSDLVPAHSRKAARGTCAWPSTRSHTRDIARDAARPRNGRRLRARCKRRTEYFVVPNHISCSCPFAGANFKLEFKIQFNIKASLIASPTAPPAVFASHEIK